MLKDGDKKNTEPVGSVLRTFLSGKEEDRRDTRSTLNCKKPSPRNRKNSDEIKYI